MARSAASSKSVYTRNGKCRAGYMKSGKMIKSGPNKGEYRCKMTKAYAKARAKVAARMRARRRK